ncbi:MAG: pyrroloquinoline quinone-dependent dehydrogenase [Bryobacteraceae bacterium]
MLLRTFSCLFGFSLLLPAAAEWPVSTGDSGSSRYSPLRQIHTGNVARLEVAWTYRTGDATDRPVTSIQSTPIVAGGVMYLSTPRQKVVALRPDTGQPLWTFDPYAGSDDERPRGVSRGVTYWTDGKEQRIFHSYRTWLVALDAKTGKPAAGFGKDGQVDLTQGLGRDIQGLQYYVTSPGVIYHDLLVLGSTTGEGPRPAAPGHIRAFDVRTGQQRWIFHTIPHPGQPGYETWPKDAWTRSGGANDWGGLSVDPKRGWVFAALGSAAFDFWGGDRIGDNLYANCVVALDARTGKRIWHFQTARHDVWDYDLPTAPVLASFRRDKRRVDAVVQMSKQGIVFVFDRVTGKPVFGIEERPVPESDVPGEVLSRTQPFPLKPAPLVRHEYNEAEITDITPEKHAYVLEKFRQIRHGKIYTPPSYQGTAVFPGFGGGVNWGGSAYDPASETVFVNTNEMINLLKLKEPSAGAPFKVDFEGYNQLTDDEDYPGVRPPWGNLQAIHLPTGEVRWKVVFGEHPELTARGIPKTGTMNFGGPIVTAGGLLFIGATQDHKFHAYDTKTGKILWEAQLETGAYATPCTYEVNRRQYVVVGVGGGRWKSPAGDAFVAFALPEGAGK